MERAHATAAAIEADVRSVLAGTATPIITPGVPITTPGVTNTTPWVPSSHNSRLEVAADEATGPTRVQVDAAGQRSEVKDE